MSYHVFHKETVNLCFPQKEKKSNQNQNHKNRKECLEHYTIFHDSKPFAGCMHLHPKIMFILGYECIDFSLYTTFPNLIF